MLHAAHAPIAHDVHCQFALVGIGASVTPAADRAEWAIDALAQTPSLDLLARSDILQTPAWGRDCTAICQRGGGLGVLVGARRAVAPVVGVRTPCRTRARAQKRATHPRSRHSRPQRHAIGGGASQVAPSGPQNPRLRPSTRSPGPDPCPRSGPIGPGRVPALA